LRGPDDQIKQQPREPSPLARARLVLAQAKPTEALALLEPLRLTSQRQQRWSHVIEMQVLQALAHAMGDEEQEALSVSVD
jgi:MalT-like TPR region